MMIQVFFLGLTVFTYLVSKKVYQTYKWTLLTPMLITPILLIAVLLLFHIPYDHYAQGATWLSKLLEPAVVAFAYPLYQYRNTLKKYAVPIVLNVLAGSVISILVSELLAKVFHLNLAMSDSIVPHIVTTPIAMQISSMAGGTKDLTALFVVLTAIIGIVSGPSIIRILRIRTAVAKGIVMGTSANGTGASRAFEMGQLEGTIATISMLLTATFNVFLVPVLLEILA